MTILSFVAVFAGIGVAAGDSDEADTLLVLGVFLGSAAWWLLLVGTVESVRARLADETLRWANHASGVVITVFGDVALFSLVV